MDPKIIIFAIFVIDLTFRITVPDWPIFNGGSILVNKHDKSFATHLLEPAIKQNSSGTLCNFGVK